MGSRKRSNGTAADTTDRAPKAEYTAAVRYGDGYRELIRVVDAGSFAEARQMVLEYTLNLRSVVIARRL